jgi:hypothetical protein
MSFIIASILLGMVMATWWFIYLEASPPHQTAHDMRQLPQKEDAGHEGTGPENAEDGREREMNVSPVRQTRVKHDRHYSSSRE